MTGQNEHTKHSGLDRTDADTDAVGGTESTDSHRCRGHLTDNSCVKDNLTTL
jgi:hypothetical protein